MKETDVSCLQLSKQPMLVKGPKAGMYGSIPPSVAHTAQVDTLQGIHGLSEASAL